MQKEIKALNPEICISNYEVNESAEITRLFDASHNATNEMYGKTGLFTRMGILKGTSTLLHPISWSSL